jgi:hypothetical protein
MFVCSVFSPAVDSKKNKSILAASLAAACIAENETKKEACWNDTDLSDFGQ